MSELYNKHASAQGWNTVMAYQFFSTSLEGKEHVQFMFPQRPSKDPADRGLGEMLAE